MPIGDAVRAGLSWNERVALDMIEAAAKAGNASPSNLQIADRLGLTMSAGSAIVTRLEARRLISVERFSRDRVITIIATGKSTKRPDGDPPPHWRLTPDRIATPRPPRGKRNRRPLEPPIPAAAPDRTPCFRCGVRGDIGCSC